MSRQPSSGWIQPSFDDVPSSVSSNSTPRSIVRKDSDSISGATSFSSSICGKRKILQHASSSNNSISALPNAPPAFKRPKKVPLRQASKILQQPVSESLLDKYSPRTIGDLALHFRKLKELREWFEKCTSVITKRRVYFLLVNGPSGCGKLSAVRVLGKEYGLDIIEWMEPLHWREWRNYGSGELQSGQLEFIRAPQLDEFSCFLLRTSFSSSLESAGLLIEGLPLNHCVHVQAKGTTNPFKLIIVKDLPMEFYDKAEQFASILKSCARRVPLDVRVMVVFIVSTTSGGGTQWQRLFSKDLLDILRFDVVEFNPIANTLLTKALRRIIDAAHMNVGKAQIEQLVETVNGDIRFAINELQFLHSGHGLQKMTPKASKRDSTLLLFRALGRCIYSKRNEDVGLNDGEALLPTHLKAPHSRSYPLDFDPDLIVEQTGFHPSMFALFLEENVWSVFVSPPQLELHELDGLESLSEMLDMFSVVDAITNPGDYEARDKLATYERSLPARAVSFYGCENAVQKKGSHSYKSMRRPLWLETARKIRNFGKKPKQPLIHSKNGSVCISEYAPFCTKHDQWKANVVSHHASEIETATEDDFTRSLDMVGLDGDVDKHGEHRPNSCNYNVLESELASISIEEFED